jgi:hypothetical protein
MIKRFLPIVGVCGLLSVALAGTAAAGGGGGYGGPGHFRFSDTTATANFGDPYSGDYSTSVYLDRGQLSFKAKRTPGAPVIQKNGTVLSVNEYSATTSEYGCWMIPDSAFVVAADLSSASVNVHATADMQCPGFFVSGATGGKPGLQSSIGYGGGGEPPTLITDIVVNLTWAGNGGLWKNSNSGTSKCGSYTANFHGTFDYEYATATGTVGDASGSSDPFAQVGQSTQDSNSSTVPSGACNPFGF